MSSELKHLLKCRLETFTYRLGAAGSEQKGAACSVTEEVETEAADQANILFFNRKKKQLLDERGRRSSVGGRKK